MRLTERVREFIPKEGCCMLKRTICNFERWGSTWSGYGDNRRGSITARRLLLKISFNYAQHHVCFITFSVNACLLCRNSMFIKDWYEHWSELSQQLLHLSTELCLCKEIKACETFTFILLLVRHFKRAFINPCSNLELMIGQQTWGVHGYGDGWNSADFAGFPAGRGLNFVGILRGWNIFRRGPRGNIRQIRLWKISKCIQYLDTPD